MGAPYLLVVLVLLVGFHELGHFVVARAVGVRVLRFSIGFGPVLWRRTSARTGVEWAFSAIPLGGYVSMLTRDDPRASSVWAGQSYEDQPVSRRAMIAAAGPLANFLLAWVLFTGLLAFPHEEPRARLAAPAEQSWAARAGIQAGDEVLAMGWSAQDLEPVRGFGDVRSWIQRAVGQGRPLCVEWAPAGGGSARACMNESDVQGVSPSKVAVRWGMPYVWQSAEVRQVVPGGAADRAGVLAGDRVVLVDGQIIGDAVGLRRAIEAAREGVPQAWQVDRGGALVQLTLAPLVQTQDGRRVAKAGVAIGGDPDMELISRPPIRAMAEGAQRVWDTITRILDSVRGLITREIPSSEMAGLLRMADAAQQSAKVGVATFVAFLALMSVNLGVINLLPLPVLDGGHLVYHAFEAVTGRPLPRRWFLVLQGVGLAIILCLTVLANYNDLARH